tara:strand:- start:4164 stop:4412 length:249 start_codon:yes stop_codon:yes gene_type:complete
MTEGTIGSLFGTSVIVSELLEGVDKIFLYDGKFFASKDLNKLMEDATEEELQEIGKRVVVVNMGEAVHDFERSRRDIEIQFK